MDKEEILNRIRTNSFPWNRVNIEHIFPGTYCTKLDNGRLEALIENRVPVWLMSNTHLTHRAQITPRLIYHDPEYAKAIRRKPVAKDNTGPLKLWLLQHKKNPYPNKPEKIMLAILSKMTLTQVSTWFANARRRLKKEVSEEDFDILEESLQEEMVIQNASNEMHS